MNREARQKIIDLLDWMFDRHYITSNDIDSNIDFTEAGLNFMVSVFGENWDADCWTNLGNEGTIWLPYTGFDQWDYAWYADWENRKEEYDNRLDLFINAITGGDIFGTDYVELDDIVL